MQIDLIAQTWRLGLGEKVLMSENNKEDRMQSIIHLDRFLRRAYPEHEIPVILRRHSPILGSNIIDFIVQKRNSGILIMNELNRH